jgi:hypothetical protein
MECWAANEHALRTAHGRSASPLGPTVNIVRKVLEGVIDAVVAAEIGEVAQWNIFATPNRSPDEWHTQIPEISGFPKASNRQLMRGVKGLFTMQSNGLPIGSSLPRSIALEIKWRTQADQWTRLQQSGQRWRGHEVNREARKRSLNPDEPLRFFSMARVFGPQRFVP